MTNDIKREAIYRLELKRRIVRNNLGITRENIRDFSTRNLEDLK